MSDNKPDKNRNYDIYPNLSDIVNSEYQIIDHNNIKPVPIEYIPVSPNERERYYTSAFEKITKTGPKSH